MSTWISCSKAYRVAKRLPGACGTLATCWHASSNDLPDHGLRPCGRSEAIHHSHVHLLGARVPTRSLPEILGDRVLVSRGILEDAMREMLGEDELHRVYSSVSSDFPVNAGDVELLAGVVAPREFPPIRSRSHFNLLIPKDLVRWPKPHV